MFAQVLVNVATKSTRIFRRDKALVVVHPKSAALRLGACPGTRSELELFGEME